MNAPVLRVGAVPQGVTIFEEADLVRDGVSTRRVRLEDQGAHDPFESDPDVGDGFGVSESEGQGASDQGRRGVGQVLEDDEAVRGAEAFVQVEDEFARFGFESARATRGQRAVVVVVVGGVVCAGIARECIAIVVDGGLWL